MDIQLHLILKLSFELDIKTFSSIKIFQLKRPIPGVLPKGTEIRWRGLVFKVNDIQGELLEPGLDFSMIIMANANKSMPQSRARETCEGLLELGWGEL